VLIAAFRFYLFYTRKHQRGSILRVEKAKSSAFGVAALRAAASFEKDPDVRNPDFMAVDLLPMKFSVIVRNHALRWLFLKVFNRRLPGGYFFHTARTRCIDEILEKSIKEGLEQLVILGAGLDTRAYRFQDSLSNVKVFEVDYPDTQMVKKERLARLSLSLPENVKHIPLDLNTQNLHKLTEQGYSSKRKTLFIWEGVCMYLRPEAVDGVLTFFREQTGPGSHIVFDYIFSSMVEGKCDYYGALESSKLAEKLGEPYVFGIEKESIRAFLEARGLHFLSEFTPETLERDYMTRSNGRLHGRVYGYTGIVHAQTKSKDP